MSIAAMRQPAPRGGVVRNLIRGPARFTRKEILPHILPVAKRSLPEVIDHIRVVGLLSSSSGFGMSARLCVDALTSSSAKIATADVSALFAAADGIDYRAGEPVPPKRNIVSIYHLNPPKLLPGLIGSDIRRYYRSYNIGYWAWELEALPKEWTDAIRFMDAIMVPSSFCRDAIRLYTEKPVLIVPHPVADPGKIQPTPSSDARPFEVLSVFSFGSSLERKNPLALVSAFRAAFGEATDARLILKTSGGHRYPEDLATLIRAIEGAPNIELVDAIWSAERLAAAFTTANVYASLHRSEGFGLTLAEAIMAEVPVVATDWSGNTDFCLPEFSFPVRYSLVPFHDTHPDYEGVGSVQWAEPSIEHAAEQLRAVRADPDAARFKAVRLKQVMNAFLAQNTYAQALSSLRVETRGRIPS